MREIKFRVWDTKNERMVYDPYHFDIYHYSDENRTNQKTYQYYEDWRDLEDGRGIECELMQYTEVLDKNAKMIYEGDVIQFKHYCVNRRFWSDLKEIPIIDEECRVQRENVHTIKDVVKFRNGGFYLGYWLTLNDVGRGELFERGQTNSAHTEEKKWDFEVIGNIYENNELL